MNKPNNSMTIMLRPTKFCPSNSNQTIVIHADCRQVSEKYQVSEKKNKQQQAQRKTKHTDFPARQSVWDDRDQSDEQHSNTIPWQFWWQQAIKS